MSYQLGIDLGTTYTAAAVCRTSPDRGWVEPEVVSLGSRSATVASVLFLAQDGSVLVGEAAERRALTDPDRVVREFKRRVGDPTPIMVAGRAWAPEELSARLVRWVMDRVAEREGGPADRIAITHPASWGPHKKDLLARALGGQGLTVAFLAEPQAAALHYATAERIGVGSTIAVYDLGGGTFDAAVVRKADAASAGSGPAGFALLGRPEGLERLGGVDFDEVVFEHVRAGMPDAFDNLDDTDPAVLSAVARIRRDCTEAKEALSSDTEVSIPVLLPGARGSVRLHRSEFEQMIRPRVEETVEALRKAVVSAGLEPAQLSAVLLVGGSSRIPLVAQLVSEGLGRPVAVDADPKNAIAKGAALALSPKPTASWPGSTISPVPGGPAEAGAPGSGRGRRAAGAGAVGAGAAGAGGAAAAMAAGGLAGPPTRPTLPGSAPGSGFDQAGAAARSAGPPAPPRHRTPPRDDPPRDGPARDSQVRDQQPRVTPPHRTAGPVHESANSLYSSESGYESGYSGGSGSARPEPSWAPPPEPAWDRDSELLWDDERPRRSFGLYVGVAGLAAVALIVVVLLYWPDSSPGLGVNTGNPTDESSVTTTEIQAPATTRRGATTTTVAPDDPGSVSPTPPRTTRTTKSSVPTVTSASEEPPPPPSEEPPPVVEPPPAGDGTGTQGQGDPGSQPGQQPGGPVVAPGAGGAGAQPAVAGTGAGRLTAPI